jgi:hypothetical protein
MRKLQVRAKRKKRLGNQIERRIGTEEEIQ